MFKFYCAQYEFEVILKNSPHSMYSLYGAQDVLIEILSSNSKEELRILSDLYS